MWGEKLCSGCGVVRARDEFALKDSRTGQRHSKCKHCGRRTSREHYRANHEAYIQRNRRNNPAHRERNAGAVYEYLLFHPCVRCGESDPVVLEFNHKDPRTKAANIADLIRFGWSINRLFAEIANCEVLCANCHQRFTSDGRLKYYKRMEQSNGSGTIPAFRAAANARNHALVLEFLADAACVDCGEEDWLVLQFDHLDGKLDHVSWLVGSGCSPVRLQQELVKCTLRCANCHRRRTAQAGNWFRVRQRRSRAEFAANSGCNGCLNVPRSLRRCRLCNPKFAPRRSCAVLPRMRRTMRLRRVDLSVVRVNSQEGAAVRRVGDLGASPQPRAAGAPKARLAAKEETRQARAQRSCAISVPHQSESDSTRWRISGRPLDRLRLQPI